MTSPSEPFNQTNREAEKDIEEAYRNGVNELDLREREDVPIPFRENLTELPEAIGKLTSLQSLTICNTHIKELPDSLGKLAELRFLNLSNN